MKKFFGHLKTIIIHKHYVFYFARKLGIFWQGFFHDFSKFSPTEFFESVKYYSGTHSPIDACKEKNGVSYAWLHHKARNKHHYEYWQDNFDKGTTHLNMPDKYVKEMVCDYLGAGKAYRKDKFSFQDEYVWWTNKRKNVAMNDNQIFEVEAIFSYFLLYDYNNLPKNFWKMTREYIDKLLDEVNKR